MRLDALRRIDDQQRSVASSQRARNFVREVDVPGRIDQVELVTQSVPFGRVIKSDRLGLDGDAAFTLELQRIEDLVLHLAGFEAAADLDEAIRQRGFAVVDVGDDREVADAFHQAGFDQVVLPWRRSDGPPGDGKNQRGSIAAGRRISLKSS